MLCFNDDAGCYFKSPLAERLNLGIFCKDDNENPVPESAAAFSDLYEHLESGFELLDKSSGR